MQRRKTMEKSIEAEQRYFPNKGKMSPESNSTKCKHMIYLLENSKIPIIKMLTKCRKTMHVKIEHFNKETENLSTKKKSWS